MRIVNILSKEDIKFEVEKAVKLCDLKHTEELRNLWKRIRIMEERIKVLEKGK